MKRPREQNHITHMRTHAHVCAHTHTRDARLLSFMHSNKTAWLWKECEWEVGGHAAEWWGGAPGGRGCAVSWLLRDKGPWLNLSLTVK